MSFQINDKREIAGWLSKVTTAADGLGRVRRDSALLRHLNPQWPAEITMAVEAMEQNVLGLLQTLEGMSEELASFIAAMVPEG